MNRARPPKLAPRPVDLSIGQRVMMDTDQGRLEGAVVSLVACMPDGVIVRWDTLNGVAIEPEQFRCMWALVRPVQSAALAAQPQRDPAWWNTDERKQA